MDVARVEAGLILIEVEYSSSHRAIAQEQHYSPFELGLGRLVDLQKASPFNGKRALLAEQAAGGPARRLVGLELDWAGIEGLFAKHDLAPAVSPMVHRDPVPVYKEGKQVGRATSITWGPTIKKMVGFGSVDKRFERARHAPVGRVERRGRARQGGRHRRPDAVPRPRTQAQRRRSRRRRSQPDALTESRGRARSGTPRSLLLFALLGGAVAFIVAALGSTQLALAAGLVCWAIGLAMLVVAHPLGGPRTARPTRDAAGS